MAYQSASPRTLEDYGDPASSGSQDRLKLPIPRLRKSSNPRDDDHGLTSPIDGKSRVSHACEPCRQRKTKVSMRTRLQHLISQDGSMVMEFYVDGASRSIYAAKHASSRFSHNLHSGAENGVLLENPYRNLTPPSLRGCKLQMH